MGKYLKYERIHDVYTSSEIDDILKKLIEDNLEIIHYSEELFDNSNNKSKFLITIICGKINKGTKQYL